MNDNDNRQLFLSLEDGERRDILQTLGSRLGRNSVVLEKDVWVCWALKTLFSIPNAHPMAFKGGTSLSKVYHAIERFSEDIDVTLDYQALIPGTNPFAEGTTRSSLKTLTDNLRGKVKEYTETIVRPAFETALASEFPGRAYKIALRENGECLHIGYHPLFEAGYLTDSVLIEFGGRNAITPTNPSTITPDIAEHLKELRFPEATVAVLAGERTFWEKATLIHVECNAQILDKLQRKSRHWYDLYKLSQCPIGKSALTDIELLRDVLRHKEAFFYSGKAKYGQCLNGEFKLIPSESMLKELKADFEKMLSEGMFYGPVPEFDEMMNALGTVEKSINEGKAEGVSASGE